MSSVNWQKIKSASESKAKIAHNAVETRLERNHSNPHIDKTKTYLNLNLDGRTYLERCDAYDSRVNFCKNNMKRVRSDAVTMIGLNIKLPEGLANADYDTQVLWCKDAYEVIENFVGKENVVSATADFDEVHEYYDPDLGKEVLSRPELDVKFVPEIDGKLCAKKWQTKANMTTLNNRVEDMTEQLYGMTFMNGKGGKNVSTEELKVQSARYEAGRVMERAQDKADGILRTTKTEAEMQLRDVGRKSDALKAREEALEAREKAFLTEREDFLIECNEWRKRANESLMREKLLLRQDYDSRYFDKLRDLQTKIENYRQKSTELDEIIAELSKEKSDDEIVSYALDRCKYAYKTSDGKVRVMPARDYVNGLKNRKSVAIQRANERRLPKLPFDIDVTDSTDDFSL